jgi:hypothetical protein
MASHQRNRRRLMQWERYHKRSRAMHAGPRRFVYHRGHVMTYDKVSRQGRYYPIGIRQPYILVSYPRYLG